MADFGQTFGQVFRQSFGETFGQAFGQALGLTLGQTFASFLSRLLNALSVCCVSCVSGRFEFSVDFCVRGLSRARIGGVVQLGTVVVPFGTFSRLHCDGHFWVRRHGAE